MALKYEIETLDGLDDAVKGLYEESGDKYRLLVDGIPKGEDVSGLKSKVDELLAEKKEAAKRAKEAEEAARKSAEEAARKSGDVTAIEKSWQEKFAARESELTALLESKNSAITSITVDAAAARMAAELAGDLGTSDLLLPHIRGRLAVEEKDGTFITAVRDLQGRPSAATMEELKKEFAGNPAFSRVIAGSKASGGGADGKPGGGATQKTINRAQYDALNPAERMAHTRAGGTVTD